MNTTTTSTAPLTIHAISSRLGEFTSRYRTQLLGWAPAIVRREDCGGIVAIEVIRPRAVSEWELSEITDRVAHLAMFEFDARANNWDYNGLVFNDLEELEQRYGVRIECPALQLSRATRDVREDIFRSRALSEERAQR